jgi:hypothetical protein
MIQPVKVLPGAYQLNNAEVPGVTELCNAFKAQYSSRLSEQGSGGKTPGIRQGKTPLHGGGRTPGGMRTPAPGIGRVGATPARFAAGDGRTPMRMGGATPNPCELGVLCCCMPRRCFNLHGRTACQEVELIPCRRCARSDTYASIWGCRGLDTLWTDFLWRTSASCRCRIPGISTRRSSGVSTAWNAYGCTRCGRTTGVRGDDACAGWSGVWRQNACAGHESGKSVSL